MIAESRRLRPCDEGREYTGHRGREFALSSAALGSVAALKGKALTPGHARDNDAHLRRFLSHETQDCICTHRLEERSHLVEVCTLRPGKVQVICFIDSDRIALRRRGASESLLQSFVRPLATAVGQEFWGCACEKGGYACS